MIYCKKKYRLLICVLFPLYVNFFFFTPFLHYHPAEEGAFNSNQVDIHSHLVNEHSDHHHHESGPHLDDCRDHIQLYELNTYQFTSNTKSIQICCVFDFYVKNYSPPKLSIKKHNFQQQTFIPAKLHWEKFVHTASNVSPPTV